MSVNEKNLITFMGVARFDDDGELACFCYTKDVEAGLCACRLKYDLPDVKITVETVPGTRPSQQHPPSPPDKEAKQLNTQLIKLARESKEINRSLQKLEKAAKATRFRM